MVIADVQVSESEFSKTKLLRGQRLCLLIVDRIVNNSLYFSVFFTTGTKSIISLCP